MSLRSLEYRVLRALSLFASPIPSTLLRNVQSCSAEPLDKIEQTLSGLGLRQLVDPEDTGAETIYSLSGQGRNLLARMDLANAVESRNFEPVHCGTFTMPPCGAADASNPDLLKFIAEHAAEIREALGARPGEPIAVSACGRPDPGEPATALLCVDEDELDDWWADQDVEVKADAFMRWAINRQTSHLYIEDNLPPGLRIPVRGTIGDDKPSAEDLDRAAEEQARAGAISAHEAFQGWDKKRQENADATRSDSDAATVPIGSPRACPACGREDTNWCAEQRPETTVRLHNLMANQCAGAPALGFRGHTLYTHRCPGTKSQADGYAGVGDGIKSAGEEAVRA